MQPGSLKLADTLGGPHGRSPRMEGRKEVVVVVVVVVIIIILVIAV